MFSNKNLRSQRSISKMLTGTDCKKNVYGGVNHHLELYR